MTEADPPSTGDQIAAGGASTGGSPPPVSILLKGAMSRLPQISVGTVVLTAIFNIGFFSEVGLHFIGTMDFTNFVYSLALVFSALAIWTQSTFYFTDLFLTLTAQPREAWPKFLKWQLIVLGVVAVIYAVAFFAPRKYTPEFLLLTHPYGLTTMFFIFAITQLMAGYLRLKLGSFTLADVGYTLFPIIFAVFGRERPLPTARYLAGSIIPSPRMTPS